MLEIFGIEDEYKHLKYLPPSEDKQDIENTLAELKNRVEVQESMIFEQTKAETGRVQDRIQSAKNKIAVVQEK